MTNSQKQQNQMCGLFQVSYLINGDLFGGTSFSVSLLVYTPTKTVSGMGHVSQAVNPPFSLTSQLQGEFSYLCTMESCHIMADLNGFCLPTLLVHGVPQATQNTKLRMLLNEDWKSGTANFKFLRDNKWVEVENAKVQLMETKELTDLTKLAELTKVPVNA